MRIEYTVHRCATCGRRVIRERPYDYGEAHCRKHGGVDAPNSYRKAMRERMAQSPMTTVPLR